MKKTALYTLSVTLVFLLVFIPSDAQKITSFKGAGKYNEFLDDLHRMMIESPLYRKRVTNGKERQEYVFWIRDHVHVMKALKYWDQDVKSFIELYLEKQTPSGMYYDYYYPIERDLNWRMNVFDKKYWEVLSAEGLQMHRMPVCADVEYLVVEGVYYVWQSTGDLEYIKKWLPSLEKGIMYSMTDPIRWSKKHQLIKRGYTLDTWDFQQLPVPIDQLGELGLDSQEMLFNVHEDTPMGILHGDNSGLYAACRQLTLMHRALGQNTDAEVWDHYADIIRLRTNQVCWNGKFYKHFAIEDDPPPYNTMDQENTLGISNPYTINRGVATEEMAQSVVQTYYDLIEKTKEESFAEWFGVYPPVEPFFGTEKPGQYLNGGVVTIVAGELAKAALQHGYEEYGIDIINRLIEISQGFENYLPCVMQPDGTKGHGIPDNWGQAAVASAMIEGLAGVVDHGTGFKNVTVSPRWAYTEEKNVDITIAYGQSGKNLSYSFEQMNNGIKMEISGEYDSLKCQILLPKGVSGMKVKIDGEEVITKILSIRKSSYVILDTMTGGKNKISVYW